MEKLGVLQWSKTRARKCISLAAMITPYYSMTSYLRKLLEEAQSILKARDRRSPNLPSSEEELPLCQSTMPLNKPEESLIK